MLKYIRWIWINTTGIRLNMTAQILLGLLNVASTLTMVWLSKMFIDETIRTGTNSDIWTMVALLVGTVVAGIVLRQTCYYLGTKAKVRQSNGIRLRIYDRLMHRRSMLAVAWMNCGTRLRSESIGCCIWLTNWRNEVITPMVIAPLRSCSPPQMNAVRYPNPKLAAIIILEITVNLLRRCTLPSKSSCKPST